MKTVNIYTDGACSGNPVPGGWGVVLEYKGRKKELCGKSASTTNNRMELTGVIEALRALNEPCSVNLYTDSKYVVDSINLWMPKWLKNGWTTAGRKPVANKDLWLIISGLLKVHEVKFFWVKGHAGHPENERCDQLARAEE